MSRTIRIDIFDTASIDAAVKEIRDYAKWVEQKTEVLAQRLAQYGLQRVRAGYNALSWYDQRPVDVTVEERGPGQYAIVASGETILILEFGSGIKYGAGHPQAGDFGYGPGTYPGQTHVPDPGYWWYTGDDGQSHFSVGNAPGMVMYLTAMEMRIELERIAKEVFSE